MVSFHVRSHAARCAGHGDISSIAATSAVASWSAPTGGAASYKLVYCTGSTCVQSTGLTVTSTSTNPSLTGNTSYDFAVRGTNSSGDGLSAATTTLLTVPDIPGTPSFSNITQTTLTVSWTAPTGGATTYKVARCTGAGCTNFSNIATGVSGTSYNDSNLTANTTYTYEVLGTNTTGDGLYSSAAQVTTSAAASTAQRMVRLIGHVRLRGHVRLL
jgi:hypothetical protein